VGGLGGYPHFRLVEIKMKFDPGKAWPHPVLRPHSYGDDYPHAEFEVEIEVRKAKNNSAIEVDALFELSDPNLLNLISENAAQYVLLIKAPKTHFRELVESDDQHVVKTYTKGELSGRVEFLPFVISSKELTSFVSEGWHKDFIGRSFNIPSGAVLAEDVPKDYWIDNAEESPIGSIFGTRTSADLPDGRWRCILAEDRVWIEMSNSDASRYSNARENANNRPEGQYLMNGLYLPALISVLYTVDPHPDDFRNYRWFDSLDRRLEELDCTPLGSDTADRLLDAQKILDSPFAKMPLIADLETDN